MVLSLRAYPRSFRRLLAAGFVLVGAPAAVGLVAFAFAVSSFAERAERAVYDAQAETRAARGVADALVALERNARQFLILEDRVLLQAYESNRRRFTESLRRLHALDDGGELSMRGVLLEAARLEAEVFATLAAAAVSDEDPPSGKSARGGDARRGAGSGRAPPDAGASAAVASASTVTDAASEVVRRFARLRDIAFRIQRISDMHVDREVASLGESADYVRGLALAQAFAFVPLVAVLVIGFTIYVGRPIRELDAAIRQLGRGNFRDPVQVDGPDDLVELGRRLDWMRNALVGLEQDKDRFMQEIAHSLKSSLAALREGAELLGEGAVGRLNDEQREVVDILKRNAAELQDLVVGLLQYGRARMDRSAVVPVPLDCAILVEDVVRRHAAESRRRQLSVSADARLPPILADRDKVAAILDNLVSNAIRYSPPGGRIEIVAQLEGSTLRLEVADEGPGVAPEERERIFDPFVQGRVVASGMVPGTGVGLSIAREYARAHGGSVELVDSARGARFRVELPVELA